MFEKETKSIFIDGKWRNIDSSKTDTIFNPATLEPITVVANGGAAENS